MKQKRILLLTAMTLLMFGCKAQTSDGGQAVAPIAVETQTPEKKSAQQLLEAKLKKDMPYADFRKMILADGWLPLKTATCRENMGDGGLECLQIPELDACSADGRCVMWFADASSLTKLRINTFGDYRQWDSADRKDELGIQSWEFSPITMSANKKTCPSQIFEEFLKAFSQDEATRTAFTAPLVKVRELVDMDDKGYVESLTYVPKEEYKAFYLSYENGEFHVDSSPEALSLDIKQEAADTYLVRIPVGTEGSSYRFRKQNTCWYLAEDPEPAAP